MNLQSLQHILTAQMITSAQEGQLCRSLRYLVKPAELSGSEVKNLPDEALSFVLAAAPHKEVGNATQWYRLADAEQLGMAPVKYCFSAIAALPLPVWPFYLLGELDAGAHLECFLAAYFPAVSTEFTSPDLHLSHDLQRFSVTLPVDGRCVSSFYAEPEKASFSYYSEGVGAVSVSIERVLPDSQIPPPLPGKEYKFSHLSGLQYEGHIVASRLVGSAGELTLSAHTYFDQRATTARDVTHRNLADLLTYFGSRTGAVDPATLATELLAMPDGSLGLRNL